MAEEHIWQRRDGESNPAYAAFRSYMQLRSTTKVAEELGKSVTLITRWCAEHEWVSRITAYDRYIATADTDGLVHAIAESRDKNLALMDKLRGLLDLCLDDHIAKREPPTVRWSQAATVMAKVEQNFLMMKDDTKTSEKLDNVMALMEKAISNANRAPSA